MHFLAVAPRNARTMEVMNMSRTTCREAVRASIKELGGGPVGAERIFEATRRKGEWTDDTIWQHLMYLVVNLPPAYKHWSPSSERFLFLREDGLYEIYSPTKHGTYREGERVSR